MSDNAPTSARRMSISPQASSSRSMQDSGLDLEHRPPTPDPPRSKRLRGPQLLTSNFTACAPSSNTTQNDSSASSNLPTFNSTEFSEEYFMGEPREYMALMLSTNVVRPVATQSLPASPITEPGLVPCLPEPSADFKKLNRNMRVKLDTWPLEKGRSQVLRRTFTFCL